ncbi:hypothetical protein Mapa_017604 [Marchantia paleacea]|nr:hypothetical protein Mapa_017604 [Marchantia paleacea]
MSKTFIWRAEIQTGGIISPHAGCPHPTTRLIREKTEGKTVKNYINRCPNPT